VSSKVFSAESERKYHRELDQESERRVRAELEQESERTLRAELEQESERRFRAELEQDPRDRKELHASMITKDLAVGGSVPCGNELE
jgi:hypothetical protein